MDTYAEAPNHIILDCDDTNIYVHGQQQLSLYNDYYGEYCYMPLHIYEGKSGKLAGNSLLKKFGINPVICYF
jgi:hypothetical protein